MPVKKRVQPNETVPLKLTATERKLICDELIVMGMEYEALLNNTPTGKPIMMTLDDLDDFGGYIAAEANHCEDKKNQKKLDAIFQKTQDLLDKYTDEEAPQTFNNSDITKDKFMGCLQDRLTQAAKPLLASDKRLKSMPVDKLFQFKVTLLESSPPIWRRIQVQDCTLDKLHEHIQTAMGWTNSHLHQFEIKKKMYGNPELLVDGFEDIVCVDSTKTFISDIVPKGRKPFSFKYEYDFGDSWVHEVLFEGCPEPEKGKKYPVCLEGERACPPEDIGGVWGYRDFLTAIADPDHDEHENFLEWCGGSFSPNEFNPKLATREMKKGLPDWRNM